MEFFSLPDFLGTTNSFREDHLLLDSILGHRGGVGFGPRGPGFSSCSLPQNFFSVESADLKFDLCHCTQKKDENT